MARTWARLSFVLLAAWLLGVVSLSSAAYAAVSVRPPAGWAVGGLASQEALVRANQWAKPELTELLNVYSTVDPDDFAETIAIYKWRRSLEPEIFGNLKTSLPILVEQVNKMIGLETEPIRSQLETVGIIENKILRVRWDEQGLAYEIVLAPSGESSAILVMVSKIRERSLYRRQFDEVIEELDGLQSGISPFPIEQWRIAAWIGWAVLAILIYCLMFFASSQQTDHRASSFRAAGLLFAMGMVVGVAIFMGLEKQHVALKVAGASRAGLSFEMGVGGFLAVVGVLLVGYMMGPRKRIESAPPKGSFALTNTRQIALRRELSKEPEDQ